jgi:hypothetical protein
VRVHHITHGISPCGQYLRRHRKDLTPAAADARERARVSSSGLWVVRRSTDGAALYTSTSESRARQLARVIQPADGAWTATVGRSRGAP